MADFEKLCKIIIDSNGHPKANSVIEAGYSMEHFDRLSKARPETLVKRARENLLERGIHYNSLINE